jgi:CRISPR-associated protein Cas1
MKRLLNTLFVMTQNAYLKKEGETVVVRVGRETRLRVPIITISSIVCFGDVLMSPALMGFCAKSGVTISYMSYYGRFLARVQGPVSGNVLLRKEQYRVSDDKAKSAAIARTVTSAKIANSRTVVLRALRDHGDKLRADEAGRAADLLKRNLDLVLAEHDLERIRGIEGDSAKIYFGVFNDLIVSQKADFSFTDRNRRPPLDRVNALLSFVYTMLYHDMRSALETVGLDPAVGFLHRDRPGRMSLALDLMEEMRPFIADRLVLSLINMKQVDRKGFTVSESGAVLMDEACRKTVVASYQKRKQDAVTHPYVGEDMHIGILLQTQAILLARFLRGDLDGYPAFIWR